MYDLIIKGGKVITGSGDPWYYADVAVSGERIAAIGNLEGGQARQYIDAAGKVVCPGFIDMHTHSDVLLLANPQHEAKIMQGVTTEVLGLDGLSYAPLSPANLEMMRCYLAALNGNPDIAWDWSSVREFLARFDRRVATNVAYLLPHNALRLETIGFYDRQASPEELTQMQKIVAVAMAEGAVGVSFGLDYFPGRYGNTEELIAICEAVAEHDGISVWHNRVRDLGLMGGIEEVLTVGAKTKIKVHFSHFAANGPANKGKGKEMLALVNKAREQGLDVTFDTYPYVASSTSMFILFPGWVQDGGPDAMLERLADPNMREKICADLYATKPAWDRTVISRVGSEKNKIYLGQSLQAAADQAGKDVAQFTCDLVLGEKLNAGHISFAGNEEDVQLIMQHPCHTVCSDGLLVDGKPNPRGWGAFARYLGHYSRELGILSLEETIRRMTSASAQCLGLHDRGLVKEGLAADLVIFDPQTVKDMATFAEPTKHPVGIEYVIVNGAVAVEEGKHTGVLNGRALTRG